MDGRDLDIDYITDTSESTASDNSSVEEGLFKAHLPFVLELHDIRKDDPSIPILQHIDSAAVGPAVVKIKKHKKKKKTVKDTSKTSLSTDSLSDSSSVTPSATEVKEEFYDAHESYHAIPENQITVDVANALFARSETNQNPKAPELRASSGPQTTTPVTRNEPTPPIIKRAIRAIYGLRRRDSLREPFKTINIMTKPTSPP